MNRYDVTVEGSGYAVYDVWADSEEEAIANYLDGEEKYTDLSSIDEITAELNE